MQYHAKDGNKADSMQVPTKKPSQIAKPFLLFFGHYPKIGHHNISIISPNAVAKRQFQSHV